MVRGGPESDGVPSNGEPIRYYPNGLRNASNGWTDGLKEIRALADSLIVGVTGNALPEDIAISSCGANAVLIKPFLMEALEEILVEFGPLQRS
jgi:hypothetical protein